MTEEERTSTVAKSLLVKEDLDALFLKHNLHSMTVCWVEKDPNHSDPEIVAASFVNLGCSGCNGEGLAFAVKNLPEELQSSFVRRFISFSSEGLSEVIHVQPTGSKIN